MGLFLQIKILLKNITKKFKYNIKNNYVKMEITNKHRDIYKLINNSFKRGKIIDFNENDDDYKLLLDLEQLGFLIKEDKTFKPSDKSLPRKKREKAFKWLFILNERIPLKRCEKPKFGGNGRNWDNIIHYLGEDDIIFHMDVVFGNYVYFSAPDGRWYKISGNRYSDSLEEMYDKDHIDLVWENPLELIELKY